LYTLFYFANTRGSSVARPLFFEFPTDPNCIEIDRQFLLGSGLLISPVLDKGAVTVNAYFPTGKYYDFYTGNIEVEHQKGTYKTLSAPLDTIQVHIRGGSIIPIQVPGLTTVDTRSNPFTLLVALDVDSSAVGHLFLDDGETIDSIDKGLFTEIKFVAQKEQNGGQITSNILHLLQNVTDPLFIQEVRISGVLNRPSEVVVDGSSSNYWSFDQSNQVLDVKRLQLYLSNEFQIFWE